MLSTDSIAAIERS